jgi:hypothetical protein
VAKLSVPGYSESARNGKLKASPRIPDNCHQEEFLLLGFFTSLQFLLSLSGSIKQNFSRADQSFSCPEPEVTSLPYIFFSRLNTPFPPQQQSSRE